mmetsp:Transcript_43856/g.139751  ORF Transcript_43856/g.139751 Transcript_43856/m.139751 type:complete len:880 (+) Transcript_43856:120-2759(+)
MRSSNFDALVQQSSDLVAEVDASGFSIPRVERNVEQLAEAARQLKAKTPRMDAPSDTNAATRLLAREGFNEDRLRRDLRQFELKTTYDDVLPVEATTVDEYLRQVHEMSILSAIAEAQQDTLVGFDDYMADCIEQDWAKEKRLLMHTYGRGLAPSAAAGQATPASPARRPAPSPYAGVPATPLTPRSPFGGAGNAAVGAAYLSHPRASAYAAATKELNSATVMGSDISAVDTYGNAALAGGGSPIVQCWRVLSSVVREAGGAEGQALVRNLVRGSLRHLEGGYEQYMTDVIRKNPVQAALGGGVGRLHKVHALLRVQLRGRPGAPPLDIDIDGPGGGGGGSDTTWHQIFHCLRAGFYEEALEVAAGARELANAGARLGGSPFASHLREWVQSGGALSTASQAAMLSECERLMRDPARATSSTLQHKLLAHSAVCGSARVADRLQHDVPGIFSTIEDFLWFKLILVLPSCDGPAASPPSVGAPLSPGARGDGPYSIYDLQQYLLQYPPAHYSKGGREPLQYVTVLLLSLQFKLALSYLAQEPKAEEYFCDAVHMGIAMSHHGLLRVPAVESSHVQGVDAARLIHSYGRAFVAEDPPLALEYYVWSAAAGDEGPSGSARMVKELLCECRPGKNRLLLGSLRGGDGGALARFVQDRGARARLLEAAAVECEQAAQYDEAVQLYRHAGQLAPALAIINRKLSDSIGSTRAAGPGAPLGADRAADLLKEGGEIEEDVRVSSGEQMDAARPEVDALVQLRRVRELLWHSREGRHADVLRVLAQLPFVPAGASGVDKCVADLDDLHPAVGMRLPDILLVAAESIRDAYTKAADAARRAPGSTGTDVGEGARRLREQLGAVTALAGTAKFRVPPHVYAQLARLANSL